MDDIFEESSMNKESILEQFDLVNSSLERAKIPFEIDVFHKEVLKVTVYECLRAIEQLKNILSEIESHIELLNPERSVATDAS